jgi:hypothetical protein
MVHILKLKKRLQKGSQSTKWNGTHSTTCIHTELCLTGFQQCRLFTISEPHALEIQNSVHNMRYLRDGYMHSDK